MKNLSGFNFFMPCSRSLHPQLRLLTFSPVIDWQKHITLL